LCHFQTNVQDFIDTELAKLEKSDLRRHTDLIEPDDRPGHVIYQGKRLMDLCSNDYLGLSHHPALIQASRRAASTGGCSATASRLMSGTRGFHERLERLVAELKNTEAALLLGSGYLANTGIIPALCGRHDAVFSDRLNHASIMDGIMLSRAALFRYRHNDFEHLEELLKMHRPSCRRALIVSESLFSMDGDMADIPKLVELKDSYDAMLLIDDAHATGVFGSHGEGAAERHLARHIDVITGTFGKALGSYGAYAAVSRSMKEFLVNRCRTFIFSTGLPPSVTAASIAAVEAVMQDNTRRKYLLELSSAFRKMLELQTGISTCSRSQIVPVMVGSNRLAVELQKELMHAGFFTKAIRPPTVPAGTARVRISLTADHTMQALAELAGTIRAFLNKQPAQLTGFNS
jgi:8-amino-7-oxononanoate synthase